MEVLTDDTEHDDGIMVGLQDTSIKVEPNIPDTNEHVSIKVLWSNSDSNMGEFEVIQEGIKVKSPCTDDEQSLGSHIGDTGGGSPLVGAHDIGDTGEDQMLGNTETLELKQDPDHEDEILNTEGMSEDHMLHVAETGVEILSDTTEMSTATTLTSDLTGHSDHDVIQFLLPASVEEHHEGSNSSMQSINSLTLGSVGVSSSEVITPPPQTVQAITLADGNTAFIQHACGSKLLEGQTITLDDGTTAIIQAVTNQVPAVNLVPSASNSIPCSDPSTSTVQSVQLEDATAGFLNQAVKDSLQAIILEDGTTAYLATQPTAGCIMETRALETTTLTLDQLTAQVTGVQGVLNPAVVNIDTATSEQQVHSVGAFQDAISNEKRDAIIHSVGGDGEGKVGQLIIEKGYRCKFEGCCRFYTTLHHLRVHERSHTGDRPFKCEFASCGKAFATGYGLKSHIRVHTGEKPYKCPQQNCLKAFKTSGDLQKHVRTHTGERPFKCPFVGCDRSFTTSNIRKVHIRTHTGERPYVCPEEDCGRAFASATNYKNHVRIHTGEKPYVCTVLGCGKRFTEYSSLYKHHVVHTHTKPYTCDRCGKTYRQTSTLAMHKRTAHGEDVTAESEAILFQQQNQHGDLEPPGKRARLGFINQEGIADEGEGALIINTSDPQQFAFVGGDNLTSVADGLQSPLAASQAILQGGNLAFTLADQSQQVFVITDPAQLEALQQIAKHQIDTEQAGDQSLLPTISAGEPVTLETAGITMVTEIATKTENTDIPQTVNVTEATMQDIGNL